MPNDADDLVRADERLRELRAMLARRELVEALGLSQELEGMLPKEAKGDRVRLGQALRELIGSLHQLVLAKGHEALPWFALLLESAHDALGECEQALAMELKRRSGVQ